MGLTILQYYFCKHAFTDINKLLHSNLTVGSIINYIQNADLDPQMAVDICQTLRKSYSNMVNTHYLLIYNIKPLIPGFYDCVK